MWFFLFSGLLACTGKLASASCPIEMSPPKVVVKFGDSLIANCTSLTTPIEGMGWESSFGGTGLQSGVTTLPLKIDNVKDWIIEPQCFVNLLDGRQCLESLPVVVYKTPASVSMSLDLSENTPMVEGQHYPMKCEVADVAPASHLVVYWHKGEKIFHKETFNDTNLSPVSKTSVLDVIAQRGDDGTPIWCEAKLDFWPALQHSPMMKSKSREVAVLYPPTFTKPANETVEVLAGKKMTLNCTATGNPTPVYKWHFPPPLQEMDKNRDVNDSVLTPSFELPGTYGCTASNSQGISTKYFNVIEATGDRTTFAAIVGVFAALGVLLLIAGAFFVTPDGTFSFNKGNYVPTSSGPV